MYAPSHRTAWSTIALFASLMAMAEAQTPLTINYQGRLLDGTNLVHGMIGISFRMWTAPAGGDLLYEDTAPTGVNVVDGLYATVIGDDTVTGTLTEALSKPEVWLETVVRGVPLTPRERMASVAYAAHAWGLSGNAGTVTGVTFLGTTDDRPIEMRVNNQRVARLLTDFNAWGFAPRFIVGPADNDIGTNSPGATIAGGGVAYYPNRIESGANFAFIGAGLGNTVRAGSLSGFIGAGYSNFIDGAVDCVIGGGFRNHIESNAAWSVLAGGRINAIGPTSTYAAIGGGSLNTASGTSAVVAGGFHNLAAANDSVVGGGADNVALGFRSVIPGGFANETTGAYSFAAGRRAKARSDGSFVWADATDADFGSSAPNQFLIRAAGGVGVGVTNPAYTADFGGRVRLRQGTTSSAGMWLYQTGTASDRAFVGMQSDGYVGLYGSAGASWSLLMNVTNGNVGFGVTNPAHTADFGGRIRLREEPLGGPAGLWLYQKGPAADRAFFGMAGDNYVGLYGNPGTIWGLIMDITNGNMGIGGVFPSASNKIMVAGGAYCSGATWVNASDRNLKTGFTPVNAADVLTKVAALPVSTWRYRSESGDVRHLGPTAQDFRAAFGLGYDDTSIATVDEGGVALAAIQALHAEVGGLRQENTALRTQLDQVLSRLQALENR